MKNNFQLAAIAACSKNRVIGRGPDIPWHLPKDFQYFKDHTRGHILIMGRKTLESLSMALPGRFHIIMTRDANYQIPEKYIKGKALGFKVVTTKEQALAAAQEVILDSFKKEELKSLQIEKVFIAGGADIYKMFLPETDLLYITEIDQEVEGDVYFPAYAHLKLQIVSQSEKQSEGDFTYKFKVYKQLL